MSEQPELWTCPHCGMQQDISKLGFFAEIKCPKCELNSFVHSMLANYKVESVLGIGGMSVVFQARDLVLGRPLAIKVLNDTYRDAPERIAGFENECAMMAKVRHENVVAVYSAGWARGQFFIAMELVDGRNLELIVTEHGALPALEAIEIIRQVAQGLRAAHEVGILHRDVKPGNVLISADGHAKVLDFGLSMDEKNDADEEEIIWATPYYVPPETLRREEETVRADIYALGMTLRNLLTEQDSFPEKPQTVADMLVSKKMLQPLKMLAPDLDSRLCKLVDSMTEFEPAGRPANYDEVLSKVEAVQKLLVEEADPVMVQRRLRRSLYIAVGAAVCIAMGSAGALLVALLTPQASVQEVISADVLQWPEPQLMQDAEAHLLSGNTGEAEQALELLAGESSEPTVAAVATLLRTALDVLEGKATANGYKRFAEVAARRNQVAPVSENLFDRMVGIVSAIQRDAGSASEQAKTLEYPLLRAAVHLLEADQYVHAGNPARAEELINSAAEILKTAEAGALMTRVDEYRQAVPRRAARMQLERVKSLFREGLLDEAGHLIPDLLEQKLSHEEKTEINVMSEAAVIMQAIHEMLQKKNRNVSPGMAPIDLRTAAAGLGKTENVPKEFYCVALILSGDFEGAFRENPYAADEKSTEPFAIIMRDWKARLGM